jgi:hypothetical protein
MDASEIETQIRQILREETNAIALSNKLFRPDGLFARLASTEADRREVSKSPLLQEAQDRLSQLQQAEMDDTRTSRRPSQKQVHRRHRVEHPVHDYRADQAAGADVEIPKSERQHEQRHRGRPHLGVYCREQGRTRHNCPHLLNQSDSQAPA